jgi:hypothetical protein
VNHNRYKDTPTYPYPTPSFALVNRPQVFVDKVRCRIFTKDVPYIRGRSKNESKFELNYHWVNIPGDRIGVCSAGRHSLFLLYNPTVLAKTI